MSEAAEIDLNQLNRELDRVKTHVFMGKNAAFLGSLMCYMTFVWDEKLDPPTAAVDGEHFYWHPGFFSSLEPETRNTVLMHELWHVALLHLLRLDDRDHEYWNYACDIAINNMLENEGYSFKGVEDCWKDQTYGTQAAEEIYDQLIQKKINPPCNGSWGKATSGPGGPPAKGDMQKPTKAQQQQVINSVVQAAQAARMAGQPGSIPGEVETTLNKFLAPVVPWEMLLHRFFQDLLTTDFDWRSRDRRFPSIYLPGEMEDVGRLEHLAYFLDVSGSVTDQQASRFASELKYVKETYGPKKMTMLQFDTRITDEKVFEESDPFEELHIIGRGGTNLAPVRAWVEEHKPTAAVIFSDLYCAPMAQLTKEIPIIWVAIDNRQAQVPFGTLIHIKA